MGGYSLTGPFVNLSAPGIDYIFLNKVEAVLSRPSGDTETGKYQLNGNSYVSGGIISEYHSSISRSATPTSVTIDTADYSPSVCSTPVTDNISSNGFHIKTTTTAITANANVGGNTVIHF